MYILGMESSCDETSAAIVEYANGVFEIKSNIVASQIETHRLYGGVVPEIAKTPPLEAFSYCMTFSMIDTWLDSVDKNAGITAMRVSSSWPRYSLHISSISPVARARFS